MTNNRKYIFKNEKYGGALLGKTSGTSKMEKEKALNVRSWYSVNLINTYSSEYRSQPSQKISSYRSI